MAFVGVNWGSSNFRAYAIDDSGSIVDEMSEPSGIAGLGRDGMAAVMRRLAARWPERSAVYASGMVGSNIGWKEAPYAVAPAQLNDVARQALQVSIGGVDVHIVPGIRCARHFDNGPDIMRGEEIELFGLAAMDDQLSGLVALPGTHTKWVLFEQGRIVEFFTSMSGEIYDRLTSSGLLASIVEGEARECMAFFEGVEAGRARQLGLTSLLFGARARVITGLLSRVDASSYLRGLLIGSEIADAMNIHPSMVGNSGAVPLIGNSTVCGLYAAALRSVGIRCVIVDSRAACCAGFAALHAMEPA